MIFPFWFNRTIPSFMLPIIVSSSFCFWRRSAFCPCSCLCWLSMRHRRGKARHIPHWTADGQDRFHSAVSQYSLRSGLPGQQRGPPQWRPPYRQVAPSPKGASGWNSDTWKAAGRYRHPVSARSKGNVPSGWRNTVCFPIPRSQRLPHLFPLQMVFHGRMVGFTVIKDAPIRANP